MKRITVYSKKHGNKFAIIDDEDYELVSPYRWNLKKIHKTNQFYACCDVSESRKSRKSITMHRLIIGAKTNQTVDHVKHNTLDNRKKNLRIADHNQSTMNRRLFKNNTTGYKGVVKYKCKGTPKFMAKIGHQNKKIILGYFFSKRQAAIAYNDAALKYHGEFAQLNKI